MWVTSWSSQIFFFFFSLQEQNQFFVVAFFVVFCFFGFFFLIERVGFFQIKISADFGLGGSETSSLFVVVVVCLVCVSFLLSVLFLSPLPLSPLSRTTAPGKWEETGPLCLFFFFFPSPDRKGEIKSGILVPFPAIFSTLFFLSPFLISSSDLWGWGFRRKFGGCYGVYFCGGGGERAPSVCAAPLGAYWRIIV